MVRVQRWAWLAVVCASGCGGKVEAPWVSVAEGGVIDAAPADEGTADGESEAGTEAEAADGDPSNDAGVDADLDVTQEPDAPSCDGAATTIGSVGEPCCPAGALACAGHAQKQVLICASGAMTWAPSYECGQDKLCDTTVGTCAPAVTACGWPGAYACDGANLILCGPDLVTSTLIAVCGSAELCAWGSNGKCAVCLDGEHQCKGADLLQCASDHLSFAYEKTCIDASLCDAPGGTCKPFTCPTSGGPMMVQMPQGYCIDSTEVTRAQYEAWLAKNPSTAGQPSECTGNTDFSADELCATDPDYCHGSSCGDMPQSCIDWCDAHAYCKAVGKRLCGKIGGGPNEHSAYADAKRSQWFSACVSGAANNLYPYGNAYNKVACNGPGLMMGTTVGVGTLPGCQASAASFAGVFDLSGNLAEWEDSCDSGNSCRVRGGSFAQNSDILRCDSTESEGRSFATCLIGFRCCAP